VADNHRYLQYDDGTPFFYLGDTAWELFHRLNREEAMRYLANRASKGFTVIQAVVLSELGGLEVPNAYGDLPLAGKDPAKPDEAYFRHVDFILGQAEKVGLVIGMLPTWGKYWVRGDSTIFTPENARKYGVFLGTRYKDRPIIWILGGDQTITCEEDRAILDALAAGLKQGDGGTHLITFHPRGPGLSSLHLHTAPWLDFNMSQSSHAARDHDNGLYAEHDYALDPPKPTVDGEPRYEQIPVGFYLRGSNDALRFDDYDVRQAAWWSVLAGACGHTYGNNNIWQMWQPGRVPVIGANIAWEEALDHPGAFQMGHLRRFMESLPFSRLVPDQRMILNGPATGGAKIRAARASDRSFAVIYSPRGEAFTIDKSVVKATRIQESWFDPRYGVTYPIMTTDHWGIQTYTPPSSGRGSDWVLILRPSSADAPLANSHHSQPDIATSRDRKGAREIN
jgi:hypothetical protein